MESTSFSTRWRAEVPFEIFEKAGDDERERRIGGIVSTSDLDRQSEVVLQEGLDFSYFLTAGWFNDNHDEKTGSAVGYPLSAEMRTTEDGRKAWYVEGYLLKGHGRADEIWSLAKALQKTQRRLGFSLEGGIVERDKHNPKIVKKAFVREVAITRAPINAKTSLEVLAKSLSVAAGPHTPEGGTILAPESLEGDTKKKRKKKRLKKSEAMAFLMMRNPALTQGQAEQIVDFDMRWRRDDAA